MFDIWAAIILNNTSTHERISCSHCVRLEVDMLIIQDVCFSGSNAFVGMCDNFHLCMMLWEVMHIAYYNIFWLAWRIMMWPLPFMMCSLSRLHCTQCYLIVFAQGSWPFRVLSAFLVWMTKRVDTIDLIFLSIRLITWDQDSTSR